jgi:hypothetical protein
MSALTPVRCRNLPGSDSGYWSIVIILQITIAVSVVAPVFLVLVATVKVSSNSSGILRCGATLQ